MVIKEDAVLECCACCCEADRFNSPELVEGRQAMWNVHIHIEHINPRFPFIVPYGLCRCTSALSTLTLLNSVVSSYGAEVRVTNV